MNYSLVLKATLAALLALTLGIKITNRPEDFADLQSHVVGFLEAQRFRVVETDESQNGMAVLRANNEECRLIIIKASSLGWNRDMIQQVVGDGDEVFTVFDGKVYSDQPGLRSSISFQLSKALRQLGLTRHTTYVLSVIAGAVCHARSLPWEKLSAIDAPKYS